MQALIARELVEGFGLPERQTALLLGLVPSSVSQYLFREATARHAVGIPRQRAFPADRPAGRAKAHGG